MNRLARKQRIDDLRRRLAAAQVELALCVEELLHLVEPDREDAPPTRPSNPGGTTGQSAPRRKQAGIPVVDPTTYTVLWAGQVCHMGVGYPFKLIERLARRPNCLVSYDQLIQDVWLGDPRSDETLRSEIRRVRRTLRAAGMHDLAQAIKGRNRHYGLMLDPDP